MKAITISVVAILVMFPLAGLAGASSAPGETSKTDAPEDEPRRTSQDPLRPLDIGGALGKVAISLAVVIVAIAFVAILARRTLGVRVPRRGANRELRLLDSMAVGPKRHLFVIAVGSRRLLVGSTEQNIGLLASLDDITENDIDHGDAAGEDSFSQRLHDEMSEAAETPSRQHGV